MRGVWFTAYAAGFFLATRSVMRYTIGMIGRGVVMLLAVPCCCTSAPEPCTESVAGLLYEAALRGDVPAMERCRARGADLNAVWEDGLTPLDAAAQEGRTAAVVWLLRHGARPQGGGIYGITPLMRAAENGHAETVRLLLEREAGAEARDCEGDTALLYAVRRGRFAVAELLLGVGKGPDTARLNRALLVAARRGEAPMLRLLVKHGAELEAKGAGGCAALAVAAGEGHAEAVHALMELGADPNAPDAEGVTPLMHAVSAGSEETVRCLLEVGADPSRGDARGRSPLLVAAETGRAPLVALLRAHGAPEPAASPMLRAACRGGLLSEVQRLLRDGAPVDAPDGDGRTPLMMAAFCGREAVVRLLLSHGADPTRPDSSGKTAADYARPQLRPLLQEVPRVK